MLIIQDVVNQCIEYGVKVFFLKLVIEIRSCEVRVEVRLEIWLEVKRNNVIATVLVHSFGYGI
ncbi:MAG: hypothetical protein FWG73_08925 [Planctomycetaceae bacterium]|nr:hypothetical protein [Planctomycetaceae bacterium]